MLKLETTKGDTLSDIEDDEEMIEPQSSGDESDSNDSEDQEMDNEGNEGDTDDDDHSSNGEQNQGWANSMFRVLSQKPKTSKSVILSKAKKGDVKKEKEQKSYNFEIEGEVKEEKPDKKELINSVIKSKVLEKQKTRKEKILGVRVKPSILDKDRERGFKKVATKGVVQLFNAIKQQQKFIDEKLKEAGPLDHRREKALNSIDKRSFLDVLMKGERSKSEFIDKPVKDEEELDEIKPKWDIFKDDFLTKKNKNWDKVEEDDDDGEKSETFEE